MPADCPFFTYRARPDRVVDGDTMDVRFDLGFGMYHIARIRLAGIDTAEIYGVSHDSEEYDLGREHAAFVHSWVEEADESFTADEWSLLVETTKDRTGKYGRYIAEVYRRDTGALLTDDIRAEYPETAE